MSVLIDQGGGPVDAAAVGPRGILLSGEDR